MEMSAKKYGNILDLTFLILMIEWN
jgi:hypothetical protein